jgi:hypothetical protein
MSDGAFIDRVPLINIWIDEKQSFKKHLYELVKKLIIKIDFIGIGYAFH